MRITIERGLLLKVLNHIQGIVERRNTIPILSNVKFDADQGQLKLNATDLDIDIVETVPANVLVSGATTAPAHTLYDIVRKLPEGSEVELSSEGEESQLTLSAGRSKFRLSCLPTGDFPVITAGELPNTFELSGNNLRGLIDRTRFAISTEETRYYLNGIYLHVEEDNKARILRAVATDGHRLASVDVSMPEGAEGMPGIIIPRKAIVEIRKLIEEVNDNIEVSISDTKIKYAFNGTTFTSKLIDGTFPDYHKVIPEGNDKVLEVGTDLFADAVDRVSAISAEKSRAVKLNISKGNLALSANSAENDTANEELQVDYQESDIEIGFNSRYLLDISQQIKGETMRLTLADSASPTLVQDIDDKGAIYVLMPMRV